MEWVFPFPQIQGLCLLSPLQIQGTPDLEALWFPPALFHFLRITCHCVKQLISSEFACFSLSPHGHFRDSLSILKAEALWDCLSLSHQ